MLAVIKTGGKQYKVSEKDKLRVEKINGEKGEKVEFDQVLLVSDDKGSNVEVGRPYLEGKKVEATILQQGRAKKINVVKYKAKTRYRRNIGHRQAFTQIEINSIK